MRKALKIAVLVAAASAFLVLLKKRAYKKEIKE